MRALLDVNVLIALLDADHVHHRGRFVTLDQGVAVAAVAGAAADSLCVLQGMAFTP